MRDLRERAVQYRGGDMDECLKGLSDRCIKDGLLRRGNVLTCTSAVPAAVKVMVLDVVAHVLHGALVRLACERARRFRLEH
eukprot:5029445-Prorocentrum_lima.AAC.1